MQKRYNHSNDGQEIPGVDINTMGDAAAYADDVVFSELARLMPFNGTSPERGVMPFAPRGPAGASLVVPTARNIVTSSGSADGKSRVWPFRAFLGPADSVTRLSRQRTTRTAQHLGITGSNHYTEVPHPAATLGRFDLIYAIITPDVAQPAQTRGVKNALGAYSTSSFTVYYDTTLTIAVTFGTDSSTPTRPAIPADSPGGYVIPLAYVRLPAGHTTSSTISRQWSYQEFAKMVPRPGETLRPLTVNSTLPTTAASSNDLNPGSSFCPITYLPSSMCGKEERFFNFRQTDFANNTEYMIDNSIDWRNRYVKLTATFGPSTSETEFAGQRNTIVGSRPFPSGRDAYPTGTLLTNTFVTGTINSTTDTGILLDEAMTIFNWNAAGADSFQIKVHKGTGALYLRHNITPSVTYIGQIWLEATAQDGQGGNWTGSGPLPGA